MRAWKPHGGKVQALAFSPDGRTLATVSGTAQFVALWDCATGAETGRVGGRGTRVIAFEFTPDGAHLATLGESGEILFWKPESGADGPAAELLLATANAVPASVLAFSPATGRLVTASATGLSWWDDPLGPGRANRKRSGHWALGAFAPQIHALRFTPDGARLLVGRTDLEIWDENMTGPVGIVRTNKGGGLRSIAVSPDGERAAMTLKNTVRVCRLTKGAWEKTLHWGREGVYAVAFARDGRSLLTAGADGSVRVWFAESWQETRRFDWGIGKIRAVAFSPDGLTCAAGGERGQVVVWDVDS